LHDAGFLVDSLGRYVYQRAEKSGWILFSTCSGGLVPLRVVSSSGEPGLLAVLEAPDSLSPGDAMAGGHLLQPGHSVIIEHVNVFGVLLLVATKKCFFVGMEVGFKLQIQGALCLLSCDGSA